MANRRVSGEEVRQIKLKEESRKRTKKKKQGKSGVEGRGKKSFEQKFTKAKKTKGGTRGGELAGKKGRRKGHEKGPGDLCSKKKYSRRSFRANSQKEKSTPNQPF